jgi:hypothetical protein
VIRQAPGPPRAGCLACSRRMTLTSIRARAASGSASVRPSGPEPEPVTDQKRGDTRDQPGRSHCRVHQPATLHTPRGYTHVGQRAGQRYDRDGGRTGRIESVNRSLCPNSYTGAETLPAPTAKVRLCGGAALSGLLGRCGAQARPRAGTTVRAGGDVAVRVRDVASARVRLGARPGRPQATTAGVRGRPATAGRPSRLASGSPRGSPPAWRPTRPYVPGWQPEQACRPGSARA